MPFTPFHFGPGLLLKAATPRHVSLTAFVASQVLIDLESLYNILRGAWPVHRELHTFALGTAAGLVAGICTWLAMRRLVERHAGTRPMVRAEGQLGPALMGGGIGGLSHSLLDGFMHRDIQPFQPFATANPLLGLIGSDPLYLACLFTGVLGLLWLGLRWRGRADGQRG